MSETDLQSLPDEGLTVGVELFVLANAKCQAFIPGQAAYIAKICQEEELNPLDYRISSKNDSEIVDQLITISNEKHSHLPEERKPDLTPKLVEGIYNTVFKEAHKMMNYTPQELKFIYETLFQQEKRKADELRDQFDRLAEEEKKKLGF